MRLTRTQRQRRYSIVVIAIGLLAVAGCGGSTSSAAAPATGTVTTSNRTSSANAGRASLRTAALAWANAFLTGTLDAIANLQGPQCAGNALKTPANKRAAVAELQQVRDAIERRVGLAPKDIKIRGVLMRNVTATSGEAEVEYALPQTATGNDNWVTYEVHRGQWKVADCHAPIGGSSSSKSETPATTP